MFNWLKRMLGISPAPATPEVPAEPVEKKPAAKKPAAKKAANKTAKPAAKPAAKKPAAKKDDGLDAMNKRDLLAMAKDKKVKANASMNKDAVIKAIRSA